MCPAYAPRDMRRAMSAPAKRKLSLVESLYLPEILKGMKITLGHLVRNIIDQDHLATVEYPEVRKVMPDRYRGAHRLTTRPDGKVKCVACMCCPTVCPAKCINIVAGEDPEDPIEKVPVRFEIDMLRCIYCGFCVEACPKDAIRMDTRIYEINAYTRQSMVHSKDYMRNLMDQEKPDAGDWYLEHPADAPAAFRPDLEPPKG